VVYDHFSFYDKSALLQDPDKEFFVFDLDGSKYPAAYIGLSGVCPSINSPCISNLMKVSGQAWARAKLF
jgi:hypothetical protein